MKNDPRRENAQQPTQNPDGQPLAGQEANAEQWSAQQSSSNNPNAQHPSSKTLPSMRNVGNRASAGAAPEPSPKAPSTPNPMTPDRHSVAPVTRPDGNESPEKAPLEFPGKPQRDMPKPEPERATFGAAKPKQKWDYPGIEANIPADDYEIGRPSYRMIGNAHDPR